MHSYQIISPVWDMDFNEWKEIPLDSGNENWVECHAQSSDDLLGIFANLEEIAGYISTDPELVLQTYEEYVKEYLC